MNMQEVMVRPVRQSEEQRCKGLMESYHYPGSLPRALNRWTEAYGTQDESLALNGNTMCNAIDDDGQAHSMGAQIVTVRGKDR